MKLTIDKDSSNYTATAIVVDNIHDIEGADRIKRTVVYGNNVIVAASTKIGDKMLYFQAGTQLSEEFCKHNNMYTDKLLNRETAKTGYISPKKRLVKALKLRGVISDGILMPMSSLFAWNTINLVKFKEGDSFTHVDGIEVCCKYEIPPPQNSGQGAPKGPKAPKLTDLIPPGQFKFHTDTAHLARNKSKINMEEPVVITRKFHGSSCIIANVLVYRSLSLIEKILKFLGVNITEKEYGYIWSSGKTRSRIPKGVDSDTNSWENRNRSFYKVNYWEQVATRHRDAVEKGIAIYSEIVGNGIQGAAYTYGRDLDMIVYRITSTNPDGVVTEFSWEQLKDYCDKYELEYVQEYENGVPVIQDKDLYLAYLQETYLDKSYPDCENDEGIALRQGNLILKLKSPRFILGETNALAEGE